MPDDAKRHSFTGNNGERFELALPIQWATSPTRALISLQNQNDGALLQITPIPFSASDDPDTVLRTRVQIAADQALFRSVEPSIEVKSIKLGTWSGYCFSAQDSRPKPGQWAFMTSGMLSAEGNAIHFTILSHRASPVGTDEALAAIASLEVS